MAAPILVPCLVVLRNEFNALNPSRDKGSDGWIGDKRHALTKSDHNPDETGATPYEDADFVDEVHAIDVDKTGPWPRGRDFDDCVELIRLRHQRGDDNRLQNIIWRGRIASRSWGWTWEDYDGPNQHNEHAHFSSRYTTAQESDKRPWGLLRREDDVTDDDIDKIADRVVAKMTAAMANGTTLETRTGAAPLNYNGGGLPADLGEGKNFLNYFAEGYRRVTHATEQLDELLERVPDNTPAQRLDK
jgi:hypothetical protein